MSRYCSYQYYSLFNKLIHNIPKIILGCLLYKEARYEEGLTKFNSAQQIVGYDPHLSYNVALCYYR